MFNRQQSKKKSEDNLTSLDPWDVVKVGRNGHIGHVCIVPSWNVDPESRLGKGSIIRCKECKQYLICYTVTEYGMYWKPLSDRKLAKLTRPSGIDL